MMLSPHLSLEEVTKSNVAIRKGIKNVPNEDQLKNLGAWAVNIFEPIRNHFNRPIGGLSFFRCVALNKAVGGAKNSQHTEGEAGDLDADIHGNLTNKDIFDWVRVNLVFDQLIGEGIKPNGDYEWVHISFKRNGKNRGDVLKADFSTGKAVYTKL